jgi:hypothetical protein
MTINTFAKGDVAKIVSNKWTQSINIGAHPFDDGTLVHIIRRHEGPASLTQPGPDYYLVDLEQNGKGVGTVHAHDMVFMYDANQKAVNDPQVLLITTDAAFIKEIHAETTSSRLRRKIEAKFPELFERTYNIGMIFHLASELTETQQDYILAQVGRYACALISLKDGNRRKDPVLVTDPYKITKAELIQMAGAHCTWKVLQECPYPNQGR